MRNESNAKDDNEVSGKGLAKGNVISNCRMCKEEYSQPKCRVVRDKFCSKSCGDEFRLVKSLELITSCPQCNSEFKARRNQLAGGKTPFCSISCSSKAQDRSKQRYDKVISTRIENASNHNYASRERSHNWNGGKTTSNGYVMIFVGVIGGKRKYRPEHRLVMEVFLGRELLEDEVVHHINEIKTDNNISNLKVMSRAEHASHHHAGK